MTLLLLSLIKNQVLACQPHGQVELLIIFKSNDAGLIVAAGRLHMMHNLTLIYVWLEMLKNESSNSSRSSFFMLNISS